MNHEALGSSVMIGRPLSEVFRNILDNLQDIVRSEAKLAKAELREELVSSRKIILWVGIAALSGCFCCGYALLSGFFALCRALPDWAAAAIIATVCAVVSLISIRRARLERNKR
jgi:Putative Actinobacterial Holin-X, holin superfamily III